jgi:hypothetical protein
MVMDTAPGARASAKRNLRSLPLLGNSLRYLMRCLRLPWNFQRFVDADPQLGILQHLDSVKAHVSLVAWHQVDQLKTHLTHLSQQQFTQVMDRLDQLSQEVAGVAEMVERTIEQVWGSQAVGTQTTEHQVQWAVHEIHLRQAEAAGAIGQQLQLLKEALAHLGPVPGEKDKDHPRESPSYWTDCKAG